VIALKFAARACTVPAATGRAEDGLLDLSPLRFARLGSLPRRP
jgi:hypothetical protein